MAPSKFGLLIPKTKIFSLVLSSLVTYFKNICLKVNQFDLRNQRNQLWPTCLLSYNLARSGGPGGPEGPGGSQGSQGSRRSWGYQGSQDLIPLFYHAINLITHTAKFDSFLFDQISLTKILKNITCFISSN